MSTPDPLTDYFIRLLADEERALDQAVEEVIARRHAVAESEERLRRLRAALPAFGVEVEQDGETK